MCGLQSSIDRFWNVFWNWRDFGSQLFLDLQEVLLVLLGDKVDCQPQMPEPTTPTNPMQIRLTVPRKIKVDHHIHGLNINSSRAQIRAHKTPTLPLPESMEDMVPFLLGHLSMDEIARVPKLDDLLSKQLHSHGRVAEDDGLRDVQLPEEGVQAVDLVFLVDVAVVLGYAFEGEFFHDVDGFASFKVLLDETFNLHGIRRREQHELPLLWQHIKNLLNNWLEIHRQQFIGLIKNHNLAPAEVGDFSILRQVENSSWRSF